MGDRAVHGTIISHKVGQRQPDVFGEYIGKVYREKPWRKVD